MCESVVTPTGVVLEGEGKTAWMRDVERRLLELEDAVHGVDLSVEDAMVWIARIEQGKH